LRPLTAAFRIGSGGYFVSASLQMVTQARIIRLGSLGPASLVTAHVRNCESRTERCNSHTCVRSLFVALAFAVFPVAA